MGCRKQRFFGFVFVVLNAYFIFSSLSFGATKITSIDFKGTGDPAEISIQADGPVTFEKQENPQDKQIILELKDSVISKANARKIDTSSFNSKVSLISPYQVPGKENTVRVVVQLRENGTAEVSQDGNVLHMKIPNDSASASADNSGTRTGSASDPAASDNLQANGASSEKDKTHLDEFVESRAVQRFIGKPITLQIRDGDVTDVLRLIGETSGFNILVGDDVRGKITLSLVDVPWDQALDVVLHTMHLGAERNNNILRITTLQNLTTEKQEELRAIQAAQANAPRVTRVFPISYANLQDLQPILVKLGSNTVGTGAGSDSNSTVQIDNRTNSLIVRDIPENIERMKKLIEILDTQTPQVVIEAKVIEATEGFSKNLSGSLGFGDTATSNTFLASFAGGNPSDALMGSPGVFANSAQVSAQSANGGSFGLAPSISFIPGLSRLNAVLNWGESESQLKIISSPKTVVLNKQKASIVEGTPVLVPGSTTVAGVGTVATTAVQSANVSLTVKPTVANDASVLLDLTVTKDVPLPLPGGQQGIGNRNITTQVLVESGTTLVIGGIYTMQTNHTSGGFPFLRKIPILGALFGNDSESTDRSELFIFVTPRILNPKEAGLNG